MVPDSFSDVVYLYDIPIVSVSASDVLCSEPGSDSGQFTVTRDTDVGDLTVYYSISGSATEGSDYSFLSGSVLITDGNSEGTIPITPIDDTILEGLEKVELNIDSNSSYNVSDSSSFMYTMADDESDTLYELFP